MMKDKILGLDIGSKSCGIAMTDELGIAAHGKENFMFPSLEWTILLNHLKNNYLNKVSKIIIGLPLLPSGDDSTTTKMIRSFVDQLKQETKKEIIFMEEFGSTKRAHNVMISAGLSRKKRKMHKDKLAAVFILQDYIDKHGGL